MVRRSLLGLFVVLLACNAPPDTLPLFDFESDAELNRLQWRCHTLLQLTDEYASSGAKSLEIEFHPSEYPGVAPMIHVNDWRGYRRLAFDIFNPGRTEERIGVRLDDRFAPDWGDRYNSIIPIRSGVNHIEISLDPLTTSGSKREMDLGEMRAFVIFMVNPPEKKTLYIDFIRLTGRERP